LQQKETRVPRSRLSFDEKKRGGNLSRRKKGGGGGKGMVPPGRKIEGRLFTSKKSVAETNAA